MSLIPSRRHTDADLLAWRRNEARDQALAASPQLSDWEIEAVRAIQRFAADGDAIIGTSWGKDSVVVTHLAHQAGVTLPVVRMVRDRVDRIENPDVPAVRDTYLATYPVNYAEFLSAADDGLAEMNRAYFGRYISGVRAA